MGKDKTIPADELEESTVIIPEEYQGGIGEASGRITNLKL